MARSRGAPASFFAPVALGAVVLGGTALLRAVLILPLAFFTGQRGVSVGMAMLAVVVAAGAGAFGGLIYCMVGRPLRRVRWVGPYAAGVVTAAAYLGAALWAIGRIEPSDAISMAQAAGRFAFAICVLIFGLLLGVQFAKDDKEDARGTHVAT